MTIFWPKFCWTIDAFKLLFFCIFKLLSFFPLLQLNFIANFKWESNGYKNANYVCAFVRTVILSSLHPVKVNSKFMYIYKTWWNMVFFLHLVKKHWLISFPMWDISHDHFFSLGYTSIFVLSVIHNRVRVWIGVMQIHVIMRRKISANGLTYGMFFVEQSLLIRYYCTSISFSNIFHSSRQMLSNFPCSF